MQIREMSLKELDVAYDIVKQLRKELSYDKFEDLIYEMRERPYVMLGIFEKEKLVCFAGVVVQTNLYHKRHLFVDELVTDEKERSRGYGEMMLEYLRDYAKMAMCERIVLSSGLVREDAHRFYEREGFVKKSYVFVKEI
jgi:GNAT superfamily N-acetyltransferase